MNKRYIQFSSVVQSCPTLCNTMNCSTPGLPVRLFSTPWTAACQAPLSSTISRSSLKSMSIDQWCYLTVSSSFPFAFSLSHHQGLFQWLALCIRWPKYWIFSFSISPFNEYSVLIIFNFDWFDLFAVQGTLESFPALKIWKHQFFSVSPSSSSNSYICTWLLEKP